MDIKEQMYFENIKTIILVNNYERCFYMENNLMSYQPVISDIKNLITVGQNVAYNATNRAMIMTYWTIGKRIVEEEASLIPRF